MADDRKAAAAAPHPSYDVHRRACVDCHTLGHICRPCRAVRYYRPLVRRLYIGAAIVGMLAGLVMGAMSHG